MIPVEIKKTQMYFIAKLMRQQNVPEKFISDLSHYAVLYDHFYDLARAWVCECDLSRKLRIIEILNETFELIENDYYFTEALKNKNIL